MNNELRPYDEYKEIKLIWCDKIPKHWNIKRAKSMFNVIDIRSETGTEELLSVSANYGVIKRKNANVTMFKAESYKGYKLCWKEDLAVNSLWAWQQGLGFSEYHGIISTAYSVYRLNNKNLFNYKYYNYLIRSSDYLWELRIRSKGIWRSRYQLTDQSFMDMPIIIPSKDEQDQIVKYLDFKLAKINKFIKSKKKLIEALKEQKQAVINEAVTKGINPNVKIKPSGIEWLGDIPEHWDIMNLSQIAKITLSGLDKKLYDNQKKVLLCNYVDVYKNNYITNNINFMTATASESEILNLSLQRGDIIITKDSESWDDIAVPAYVPNDLDNVCCAYHLALIRKKSNNIISEFLYSAFLSQYVSTQYKVKAKGVTRYGLSYQSIRDVTIFVPTLNEQEEIINRIKFTMSNIDKAIEKIQNEIDLITEYRTSLISDVVTGKVDVMNIKIHEIIEEDTEIDETEDEEIDKDIILDNKDE